MRSKFGSSPSSIPAKLGLRSLGNYTRSSFGGLLARLRQYEALTVRVRELLPAELAPHLFMAQLQDTRLVLLADASVWASKLRFMAPKVRKEFPGVLSVRVAVRIEPQPERPSALPKQPVRTLSAENAGQLRTLAASISDPGLKAVLLRLASHGGK